MRLPRLLRWHAANNLPRSPDGDDGCVDSLGGPRRGAMARGAPSQRERLQCPERPAVDDRLCRAAADAPPHSAHHIVACAQSGIAVEGSWLGGGDGGSGLASPAGGRPCGSVGHQADVDNTVEVCITSMVHSCNPMALVLRYLWLNRRSPNGSMFHVKHLRDQPACRHHHWLECTQRSQHVRHD